MRYFIAVAMIGLLLASCGVKPKMLDNESKNDTLQFTFSYSEGLKNKMLGRDSIAIGYFYNVLILILKVVQLPIN